MATRTTERRTLLEQRSGDTDKETTATEHWVERIVQSMSSYADPRLATEAGEIVSQMSKETTEDVRAIVASYTIAATRMQEMQKAWADWVQTSMAMTARASNRLLQSRDLKQLAEIQREFVEQSLGGLLQGSADMLRLSTRAAEDAVRPIEERIATARKRAAAPISTPEAA